MKSPPAEECNVTYFDDCAVATLTVCLEYDSEHPEGGETPPSPLRSVAFDLLAAAVERYLAHTLGPDTSRKGRLLKPHRHEVRRDCESVPS